MENSEETIYYATVSAYAFTQYSLKRALKELGVKGETPVTEVLSQIHMMDKFFPESDEHLTKEQKKDSLKSLMFLKVDMDGIVKGQTCTDGP